MTTTIPTPGPRRVQCPGCEKFVAIRKDGTFWHHRGFMPEWSGSPFKKVCGYSGVTAEVGEPK